MNEVNMEKLRDQVKKALDVKSKCLENLKNAKKENYPILRAKFDMANEKYWILQEKFDYLSSNYVAGDNEIEIKRFGDTIENMYDIYLKDKGIKIGHIDYRGYHFSDITGDIGYVIDSRYKGHNYGYKSLSLLVNYLYQHNIPDFYISVYVDNIPSLKIVLRAIMNFGGEVVKLNGNMVTFECKTNVKNDVVNKM